MIPESLRKDSTEFCIKAAEFMSRCSLHAYLPEDAATQKYKQMGATEVVLISVENHQAYVVFFDHFAVVAFRGTEKNFEDIQTDLDFELVPSGGYGMEIHKGFGVAATALLPGIEKALSKREWLSKPTYFGGHSLGGAIAQACALDADWGKYTMVVYSFGSPRLGNEELGVELKMLTYHYRIINGCDIVPNLPLLAMGFEHSEDQTIYLTSTGKLKIDLSTWRRVLDGWLDVALGITDGFRAKIPIRRFTRHRIAEYVDRLQRAANG